MAILKVRYQRGGIQQKSIHDKPKIASKPIGLDLRSFHSKLKTIESFTDFSWKLSSECKESMVMLKGGMLLNK